MLKLSFFLVPVVLRCCLACAADEGGVAENVGPSQPDAAGIGGSTGFGGGSGGIPSGGGGGSAGVENDGGLGGAPPDMVVIPAGQFTMGCTSQTFCYCDEYPSRQIQLSEFLLDRTEVTREAYAACVATGSCTPPIGDPGTSFSENPLHPVANVDWEQANQYCVHLGKRLPSAAEWERAYRSTDARVLPWGTAPLDCTHANYGDCALNTTEPVGSHPAGASAEGVLDLAGNVWEWVADRYADAYYQEAAAVDPGGPSNALGHEYRGGGFKSGADRIYPYLRYYDDGGSQHQGRMVQLGFRCAKAGVPGATYVPSCSCPDPFADPVCN